VEIKNKIDMDNNWNELGYTQKDKYPDDGSLEVQFAVIEKGKLKITWVGRDFIKFDNANNQVHPTHWRYIK